MDQIEIGQTGLRLSAVGFGTSALGDMPDTYGYGVDEARARATLELIFEGPATWLDTSRNYGMGRSEERVGAAIRDRGGVPEGFAISTKLDRDMETRRFDADRARQSLEESLSALGLDRVDLLHLHDPEHARDLGEIAGLGGAMETLFAMKEEGLATAIGLAMGQVRMQEAILEDWPVDAIITHNRFTLLNRNAEPLLDRCAAAGIAVINAAPYAGGVLAKGSGGTTKVTYQDADDAALAPVREIEAICAAHGVPIGAAALQFSMRDPRVTATLIGVTKPGRVEETLAWAGWTIPEAAWEALMALPYATDDPESNRVYSPG